MSNVIEESGLDWLVLITGKPAFTDPASPFPGNDEIKAKLGGLKGEKLGEALKYCESILQREENRLDKIESKAFTLIGITGIVTAFITAFASLLLDRGKISSTPVLLLTSVIYVLTVASLIFTIYLALKVVRVIDYQFSYPDAADILSLSTKNVEEVQRERTVDLFLSFATNSQVIDRKGTYLGGAQLWFRNSMVLLLVLTLLVSGYVWAIAPSALNTPSASGTLPTKSVQPAPSNTASLSPSPSIVSPTNLSQTPIRTSTPAVPADTPSPSP